MIRDGGLVCMMPVEGMVGRTCTIGNTVTPPYVLVTNEGHAVSQLSGHDTNQHRRRHMQGCFALSATSSSSTV